MSRLIKEDFDKLCTFIKDYSLSDVLKIDDAKKLLSSFHKKYFAYLVLIEGIHHKIEQYDEVLKMSKEQYEYLQESCSDVGQAFFLTFHGCYKGAKLLLRSSIENFLKGSCLDEDKSLPSTKSVYEVLIKQGRQVLLRKRKQIFMRNFIMSMPYYVKMCIQQMFPIWLLSQH